MIIDFKYKIEDIVFLITDTDQKIRIVTAIQITKNNVIYRLASEITESWHYDFEIATVKNYNY
jgi:hypothetical protein